MRIFLAVLVALGACNVASAQVSAEQQLREQLRKTVTDLRALQDENADLKSKLTAAATPKIDDEVLTRLKQRAGEMSDDLKAAQKDSEDSAKAAASWRQKYENADALARQRDADARRYQEQYRHVADYVSGCGRKNAMLVQISEELIARYKDKDFWDTVRSEPLTGVHHVTFEHIAQDYHAKSVDAVCPAFDPEK